MKILYGSNFRTKGIGNSERRCNALKALEHHVIPFDFLPYIYRYGRISARALHHFNFSPAAISMNRALHQTCRELQPDIIWLDKGKFINRTTLRKIRNDLPTVKLVHYNPDDPFGHYNHNWRMFKKAISSYDTHFVPNEGSITDYKKFGAQRVIAFDRSYSKDIHRPVDLDVEDQKTYETDVGFIGSWAPYREKVIAHLIQQGIPVAVYGVQWQKGPYWRIIKPHYRGGSRWGDEYAKAICGMKIALHFLRHENRDEQDSRTFEIPACGTFMLAEYSPKHTELFEDGKEAVFFKNEKELASTLVYYLKKSQERIRIAEAGRNRCIKSGYDHQSRMLQLINKL